MTTEKMTDWKLELGEFYLVLRPDEDSQGVSVAEIRHGNACVEIVHRYNSQPALLAAAEKALPELEWMERQGMQVLALAQLRAAIQLAKVI